MRAVVDGIRVRALQGESRENVERMPDPVYVYVDATRGFSYGAVWAWGVTGRPVAVLTIAEEAKAGDSARLAL